MRNLFLACRVAVVIVSFSVADAQADMTVTPSDLCNKDRIIDPQLEVDAGFIAKSLHDGVVKVRPTIEEYIADLKKRDNFSDTHTQPYFSHLQILYSAVLCADPADISATLDPKDNSYKWTIHYWRANTNEIYETAKGHAVTPDLIAGANHALNNNIRPADRDQAIAQFNTRALLEKQPMRIGFNSQRELELRAATVPNDVSK